MPAPARNLIVLSDGTGNSSAKLFRTNVWRVYDALDLTCQDQIALYDNGVGTAGFKPLAVLGGACGFGLKRNVLDLYKFLCRNYEPGDRIFAFGFSRGAFTARVVVALVAHQGLIQGVKDDGDLKRLAAWAYRRYRADKYRDTLGVRFFGACATSCSARSTASEAAGPTTRRRTGLWISTSSACGTRSRPTAFRSMN